MIYCICVYIYVSISTLRFHSCHRDQTLIRAPDIIVNIIIIIKNLPYLYPVRKATSLTQRAHQDINVGFPHWQGVNLFHKSILLPKLPKYFLQKYCQLARRKSLSETCLLTNAQARQLQRENSQASGHARI